MEKAEKPYLSQVEVSIIISSVDDTYVPLIGWDANSTLAKKNPQAKFNN